MSGFLVKSFSVYLKELCKHQEKAKFYNGKYLTDYMTHTNNW